MDNGRPLVESYALNFYVVGLGIVVSTIDLGKPTPDADGLIRMDFSGRIGVWPASGLTYEARVVALGAGGFTTSDASNTFIFGSSPSSPGTSTPTSPAPSSCTYDVWPPSRALSWIEATSTFSVTAGSGCAWAPVASDSWLTPTDLRSRSGDGTVTFRTTENTGAMGRVGTISIGSATAVVTQTGTCGLVLTPASQGFNAAGGTGAITVTAAPGCSWTAIRAGSWLSITSGASGSGNGTVRYSVSANAGSTSRTATLTIAGQPVAIIQSATTSADAPTGLRVVVIR